MLEDVAALVREQMPGVIVHCAHMELAEPTIEQGLRACVLDGANEIRVHPYMLSPGRHAAEDIPRIVEELSSNFPGIAISVTEPLGVHNKIAEVVAERSGFSLR